MNAKNINMITNVMAVLLAILEPVRSYLQSQPFSWPTFGYCIFTAVVAWYTGKSTLAEKKS